MPLSGGSSTASGKPTGGWLKTDLETAVQDSLVRADTSLPDAERGAINGVASLDSVGKVPLSQLPFVILTVAEYAALATKDPAIVYLQTA